MFLGTALLNQQGDEYEWTVQTYDGKNDALLGQTQTYDGGGVGDGIGAMKLLDDRLYAAGYVDRADGGFDFAVRAYDVDAAHCDIDGNQPPRP